MAKAGIREAKSAMLPTGVLTKVNSLRKFGLYTMDGAGNITTEITPGKIVPTHLPDYFLGGYASWEIDIWGKLKAGKKLAISNFWLSKEAHKLVIGGILSEISVSYFQNIKCPVIDIIYPRVNFIFNGKEVSYPDSVCVLHYDASIATFTTPKVNFVDVGLYNRERH
jgi:hypothetical protein